MKVWYRSPLLLVPALVAFLAFDAAPVAAQATGTITGTVTEAGSQRPVPSASVYVAGTGIGTLSNSAGRFVLSGAPAGEVTLRVEVIGYAPQERTLTLQADQTLQADFELRQSTIELSQIVVTGAGAGTERRRLGNTIATIDAAAMQNAPVSNISEILQGREPGVVGLSSGGMAGEGSRIRIRGSSSLSQSNEPVIYVDGVRIDGSGGFGPGVGQDGGSPSRLDDINPASIERIEILKGAAAATLYGTQASNGVIQIFTKRGQTGAPRYNLQVEQGFTRYPGGAFPMHAGFATSVDGSSRDRGTAGIQERWGVSVQPYEVFEVDMINDLFETGTAQTYSLSVDGGTSAVTYFVSGRLHTEDGPFGAKDLVAPGFRPAQDVNDRKQFSANVMIFPRADLRVRVGSNYTEAHQQVPDNNNNIFGALSSMLNSRPERAHAGNLYGSPAFATTRENLHRLTTQDVQRFGGNLSANYQPTPSLSVDATVGVDMVNQQAVRFIPFGWNVDEFTASSVAGSRVSSDRNNREITLDVKSTWNAEFGQDFTSSFLVGAQGFITKTQAVRGIGDEFPGPGLEVAGAARFQSTVESFAEEVNAGFFLQEQVGFRDYIFGTVGGRYDRHSAFGETAGGVLYPKVSLSVVPSDLPGWEARPSPPSGSGPRWVSRAFSRAPSPASPPSIRSARKPAPESPRATSATRD
jgi:TonB-dependent starch-binding outer membrane protein SusC